MVDGLLRGPLVHHGARYDVEAEIRPRPVQQPRPPIWVAAVAPNRRPLERAVRWDGAAVLGPNKYVRPDEVAEYLADTERPAGWDVVAVWAPGVPADEYVDVGVSWLVELRPPLGDWVDSLRARIRSGP